MKRYYKSANSILNIRLLLLFVFLITAYIAEAQKYDKLKALTGSSILTYYSDDAGDRAEMISNRCNSVMNYYSKVLGFAPKVTLLVLNPEDWPQYTNFPVYGMPHYTDDQTLIVASEDNDFWRSFIPPLDGLPEVLEGQIRQTYTDEKGVVTMRDFFDLLAIHELGHAFHFQGGLTMHRKWLQELFANIFLHTYIAENEPRYLPALTVFPQMVIAGGKEGLKYTSLADLESRYDEIGMQYPKNYGWYQCRWHAGAKDIYDQGGIAVMKNLWTSLKARNTEIPEQELASFLNSNVHASVAEMLTEWDK